MASVSGTARIMAKDKSEKKEKKSKEVTEKVTEQIVTGQDVEMADVTVAKVRAQDEATSSIMDVCSRWRRKYIKRRRRLSFL